MLVENMLSTVTKYRMLAPGDKVLVAVSGGPDSMALLHALHVSRDRLSIDLCAFHLDHMFRGEASRQDAETVRCYCSELGVPAVIENYDVPSFVQESGLTAQEAARLVRYELAALTAASLDCTRVAVAHHRDDNLETVVMRFLRGSGLRGLVGIRPVRAYVSNTWSGSLIRPLIECSRQDIEAYCREHNIPTRTDESNLSTKYARNRVRIELIPQLLTFNPNLAETVSSMSGFIADEDDYMEKQSQEVLESHSKRRGSVLEVDLDSLVRAHPALSRRVIMQAVEIVRGTRKDTYSSHVEEVLELARADNRSGILSLPDGVLVRKRYGVMEFGLASTLRPDRVSPYRRPLRVPGITAVPYTSKAIVADIVPAERLQRGFMSRDPSVAHMDYDVVSTNLSLRNRRDGDRFRPLGMIGTKKLKEFFIDNKIRSELRDRIPLVVYGDGGGRIAWVGELRLSEDVKVTDKTRRVLRLSVVSLSERLYGAEDEDFGR